jgi:hypothetical protein
MGVKGSRQREVNSNNMEEKKKTATTSYTPHLSILLRPKIKRKTKPIHIATQKFTDPYSFQGPYRNDIYF